MELSEKEIAVLISCIRMASSEGFYRFEWDGIEGGREATEELLKKFGVEFEKAKEIMEGW